MITTHAAPAAPTGHTFRTMINPPELGELRSKTWRLPLWRDGKDEHDPEWTRRAANYWARQMQLFGYVVGDFTLMADVADGIPIITTIAPVLAILPGERVADYQLPDKVN
jgi:hypothetical protein